MELWERVGVVSVVILAAVVVAKLIDRRMAGRELAPDAVTRYRVLRRGIMSAVIAAGVLFALLVIPQVRAVAGGILASSAVLGLILGLASRSTIANFVAGLLIAFTQPLRIGDDVEIDGVEGTVEEIGLTYTFIRARDGSRLVTPNEKLALDTIRNSTIVSRDSLAEVTLQVPLDKDLAAVVGLLEQAGSRRPEVLVTRLDETAHVTLRVWAEDDAAAERIASELLSAAHASLHAAGVYG